MSTSPRAFPPAPRRKFLGQLATTAAALAGTTCVGTGAAARATSAQTPPRAAPPTALGGGDDDWTSQLTGKHKVVFDAPEIADGVIVKNAYVYLMSYKEAHELTDADLSAVAVIRHAAIPMAYDDAMWEKYELGRFAKVRDPATKKWARRNPFWRAAAGDAAGAPFTLDALRARGVILLGCGLAARRIATSVAERTSQSAAAVGEEMRTHLLPGLRLAPSGIYAVTRAQEVGCSYVRST